MDNQSGQLTQQEESAQLKQHIDSTRRELGRNLGDLQAKVRRTADWRAQFHDRPARTTAIAFAAGLILAKLLSL
ncbi:MAG TPA: hypothetical protein VN661_04880 [Candidatus Acidoferrales bacterium]|nr:hypothetical protein [Candidatus Acidoferrales bacterium]